MMQSYKAATFCGVGVHCATAYIPPVVLFKLGAYGVRVNGHLGAVSRYFSFVFNAILDTCFLFSQIPTTVPTESRFPLTIPATFSTRAHYSLVPPPLKSAGNLIGHARISIFDSISRFYFHLLLFSYSRMAMMRGCRIGGFDVYDHVARLCSSSILLKHAESHVYLSMYGRKRLQFWKAQQYLFVCLPNSRPIPLRMIYFSYLHFYILRRGRKSLFYLFTCY
jgi:hypothetical protein